VDKSSIKNYLTLFLSTFPIKKHRSAKDKVDARKLLDTPLFFIVKLDREIQVDIMGLD